MNENDKMQTNRKMQEKVVLMLNTLYMIYMSYALMSSDVPDWPPFLIMTFILVCLILYVKEYQSYELRTKTTSLLTLISFSLYAIYIHSFYTMIAPLLVLVVSIALYGEVSHMRYCLEASLFLMFYFFLINPVGAERASVFGMREKLFQIASLFLGEFLIAFWLKNRVKTAKQVQQNIKQLEDVEKEKDDFFANVSHEIRTPINTINGMCTHLLEQELPAEMKSEILDIKNAGRNLTSVVGDILDFSELQSDKMALEEEAYCIKDIIDDVVSISKGMIDDDKMEILVDCDASIPKVLYGDEKKIRRVIMNLVSNAIKFTQEGYVEVAVAYRREAYGLNLVITVSDSGIGMKEEFLEKLFMSFNQVDASRTRKKGGIGIGLSISQKMVYLMGGFMTVKSAYGKGSKFQFVIPQKIIDEKPIFQLDEKTALNAAIYIDFEQFRLREVRDSYYELAGSITNQIEVKYQLCKNIPELKRRLEYTKFTHVVITVYEYLQDPQFFIKLADEYALLVIMNWPNEEISANKKITTIEKPFYTGTIIEAINSANRRKVQQEINAQKQVVYQNAKVLAVDDNVMNLRVVSALLEKYKIGVETACSGAQALEKVTSKEYDLIFMDHMMPEMDGVETLHHIREKDGEYYRKVPVIALTANALSGAREYFLSEGFDDYVEKPLQVYALEKVLMKFIPQSKRCEIQEEKEEPKEVLTADVIMQQDFSDAPIINKEKGYIYCGGEASYKEIIK